MMGPVAAILPCGTRLHLQHGPIDLIIGADGDREVAFQAARNRFDGILEELVAELPLLRQPLRSSAPLPEGEVARLMDRAARPHSTEFVTRMAAVAGAVADTVLEAMCAATPLRRAYVNNGGDVALQLEPGQSFTTAIADHAGCSLGRIQVRGGDGIGGIATSGRHGRSLSLGIADSVTVLGRTAAEADCAATLIANAVDLSGHPAVTRRPASDLSPDSDLGDRPVVTHCGPLSPPDVLAALASGAHRAKDMQQAGHIVAAALFLQGETCLIGQTGFTLEHRIPLHA